MMLDILTSFLPLYFTDVVGVNEAQASVILSLSMGASLTSDLIVIRLLERYPGRRILRWSAGVIAVLLPGTAYFLHMQRYARARDMIAAGVPIALATDFNPGSCMTESLPLILNLACTQMRVLPAEAITAATINAAPAYIVNDIYKRFFNPNMPPPRAIRAWIIWPQSSAP